MAIKLKSPIKPVAASAPAPGFARTVPAQLDTYLPGDKLPEPDVVEKDSDSVWALWSDAVKDPAEKDTEPMQATQLMGLDELPKERGA